MKTVLLKSFLIFSLILGGVAMNSCSKDKDVHSWSEGMAELDKFLKANDIPESALQPEGYYYIPIVEGTGAAPQKGDVVKMYYTGRLLNGKVFDENQKDEDAESDGFKFTLGFGQVIKGWDLGVAKMKVGGKARLIIPSNLGYGPTDMGDIPSYSALDFEVELVSIEEE